MLIAHVLIKVRQSIMTILHATLFNIRFRLFVKFVQLIASETAQNKVLKDILKILL